MASLQGLAKRALARSQQLSRRGRCGKQREAEADAEADADAEVEAAAAFSVGSYKRKGPRIHPLLLLRLHPPSTIHHEPPAQ